MEMSTSSKLDFEKQQCELFRRLMDNIEGNYINQVDNITRQMTVLAEDTYRLHPEFLRGFTPRWWLKQFVNGDLK